MTGAWAAVLWMCTALASPVPSSADAEGKERDERVEQLFATGRVAEAEALARESLEDRRRAGGDAHLDFASSLHNLVAILLSQGKGKAALPLSEEYVAVRRAALERVRDTAEVEQARLLLAMSLGYLAKLRKEQANYSTALALHDENIAIRRSMLGEDRTDPDWLDFATQLNNLATVYRTMGNYAAAEPIFEEALTILENALGEHPRVGTILNNLAGIAEAKGDYDAARLLYERSLAAYRTSLGDGDPLVGICLGNLAGLAVDQGHFDEAQSLFEESAAIFRNAPGQEGEEAVTLNNLGLLLREQGKFAEARQPLEDSLAMTREALGDDHPDVATGTSNLAMVLESLGLYGEARRTYEKSLAISKANLGEDHPNASARNNLASLLIRQGDYVAARGLLEDVLFHRRQAG